MDRATSFGADVAAYELGRPEYVDAHVAWLLEGIAGPVLDLGAGSGKLTRALQRLGLDVTAVDPDAAMLDRNPAGTRLIGTADAIPVPDATVAAVTVGQAWHWFDPATAGPEIARVLRPGGRLGLVWNTRDASHPFVAALATIAGPSPAEQMVTDDAVTQAPGFGPFERRQWARVREMTPAEVEAMVTSRSAYLTAVPSEQQAMLADLRALIASHPAHGRARTVRLPVAHDLLPRGCALTHARRSATMRGACDELRTGCASWASSSGLAPSGAQFVAVTPDAPGVPGRAGARASRSRPRRSQGRSR